MRNVYKFLRASILILILVGGTYFIAQEYSAGIENAVNTSAGGQSLTKETTDAIHGHINDFLVRTGLRSGVSELQLPCFTAVRAEIALMSDGAFAVTHHPVSS